MGLFKPNISKLIEKKDTPQLIKALSHRNDGVRERAAAALGILKETRAVDHLVSALKDPHWLVRIRAAQSLGQIGDGRAVDPLIGVLTDVNVREAAIKALAEIVDDRSVDGLISALKNPDAYVRWTAAAALGQKHDPRAVGPLISALKDSIGSTKEDESFVHAAADKAIKEIGLPADPTILAQYAVAKQDWDKAVSFGRDAVELLIAALKDGGWEVRKGAASSLGKIRDARAVEPLISLLKDRESYGIREGAAKALGEIGDCAAIQPLIAAVRDKDSHIRKPAGEALAKIGLASVEPLVAMLDDGDSEVCSIAREALAQIGLPAEDALIAALARDAKPVRCNAADVLGRIGSNKAFRPLLTMLRDPNTEVRYAAAAALEKIGLPDDPSLLAYYAVAKRDWKRAQSMGPLAVEPLAYVVKSAKDETRKFAAAILVTIGEPSVNALISHLKDESAWVRENAANCLREIQHGEHFESLKKGVVRKASAGDKKTVEALRAILNNSGEEVSVRKAAALAIEEFGIELDTTVQVWSAIGEEKWKTVVSFGSAAVEPLISAVRNDDGSVCGEAVKALAEIRDLRAVEPLIAILRNNDGSVCREAVDALEVIHDVRAIEPLIAAIKNKDGSACDEAVRALGKFGDERAVEPIIAVLKEGGYYGSEALLKIGKPSVEPLIKAFRSGGSYKRWEVAEALVKIYRHGKLDEETKQKILSMRSAMYRPHSDSPQVCSLPHGDTPEISL
jgi:HEAT repeat protein